MHEEAIRLIAVSVEDHVGSSILDALFSLGNTADAVERTRTKAYFPGFFLSLPGGHFCNGTVVRTVSATEQVRRSLVLAMVDETIFRNDSAVINDVSPVQILRIVPYDIALHRNIQKRPPRRFLSFRRAIPSYAFVRARSMAGWTVKLAKRAALQILDSFFFHVGQTPLLGGASNTTPKSTPKDWRSARSRRSGNFFVV